jgi:protease-4
LRRFVLLLALVVGLFLVGRLLFGAPAVPKDSYVLLTLQGSYEEAPSDTLLRLFAGLQEPTLFELVQLVRQAAEDTRIAGMVVRVRPLEIGWAKAQELRSALHHFRSSGKRLWALLDHEFMESTLEYYVASAAERIYLPPSATAPLAGLTAQYLFLGGLWERLDIEMQVEKIREYKTAGDTLVNKEMSPHHREMANSLLDSIFGQVVTAVAHDRKLDPAAVRATIDRAPITGAEFQNFGLADGTMYLDEIRVELVGSERRLLNAEDYLGAGAGILATFGRRKLAVIYGTGTITSGESVGGVVTPETMGADTIAEAFDEAVKDDDIEAIVFRIDSPGGSALGSDLIWQAVKRARKTKPVIASMSDVAASGGYYAAAAASRIFAQPGTLTGSIGVVVAKPNISGFLSRYGVTTESLTRGELANLQSLTASFDEKQQERVLSAMNHVYDLFVQRVAEGRGLSPQRVEEIGRGRVWTGEQAAENGLVSDLGGFSEAIEAAKSAVGVDPSEKVRLVFYPRRKGVLERISALLGAQLWEGATQGWKEVGKLFAANAFPEAGILTRMPYLIEIR